VSSPISNWVILPPGVEKRLRFDDHTIVSKQITDPVTEAPKVVKALDSPAEHGPTSQAFLDAR